MRSDDSGEGVELNRAINAWLAAAGFGELSLLGRICSCWVEVVGAPVAEHVRPAGLDDRTLIVEVDDPTWATQLAFLSAPILEGLSEHLGLRVADRLKTRVRGGFGVE